MKETIFVARAVTCATIITLNYVDHIDKTMTTYLAIQELNAAWMAMEWLQATLKGDTKDVVSDIIIPGIATLLTFVKNTSILLILLSTGCLKTLEIQGNGTPTSFNANASIIALTW
jgi:hypothetical protein